METHLSRMSQPIHRLLSKKDMFPRDSRLIRIVLSCNNDGYKALKNIIFASHPAFHDQPATLITSYPKQRNSDLLQYAQLFQDLFLQLRAYIANNPATLDDPTEVDIFINNLTHSHYINRVTRDERRQPHFADKYFGSQLIETIMTKLLAPDSPACLDDSLPPLPSASPPPKFVYSRKTFPRKTPINHLHHSAPLSAFDDLSVAPLASPPDPIPSHHDDSCSPPSVTPDAASDAALTALYSITAPTAHSDLDLYYRYCASVHRLHADPAQINNSTCLVCGATHRFDSCPVLANTEFLRSHYIRYCQWLRRDATARSSVFPSNTPTATPRPVHHLLAAPSPPDSDYKSDEDFQRGRA
jgi:hypothetical protein